MEMTKQRMMKLAGLLTESINEAVKEVNLGKDPKSFAKADELDQVEPGLYRIWWD